MDFDSTRDFFDANASDLQADSLIDKWEAVAPLIPSPAAGATVLECGAGTGLYTRRLLDLGYLVTAVDLSEDSLTLLRSHIADSGRNLNTVAGDFVSVAQRLEQSFDLATFIKVLHHFPDLGTIESALQIAYKRLKPGGRIVIFEPNGRSVPLALSLRLRGRELWQAERNFRLTTLRNLLPIASSLEGSEVTAGYRHFIPGEITTRLRFLIPIDRSLSSLTGFKTQSVNVWLRVGKPSRQKAP